ncbi:MAG: type II secretion system minor pseudopilin GspK [Kiritimatiellae bacterium]|nr:type II secretion system minor pseudopilin GspK [Kiritimatiellia bacterium]
MTKRKGQTGIALITAIFVVALAAIAAVSMITSANVALHRTSNLQGSEQAEWYALSIESWVCSILQRNSATLQRGYTSLGDPWARPITGFPIDHGVAAATLTDLQGRFNINNFGALNPAPYMEQFQRLVASIPALSGSNVTDLGPAIRDWIDFDSDPWAGVGAEDIYYMSLQTPYRTSNRLMKSPSELLAVRGMTPQVYEALYPYITTLPTTSARININTAPLPVLESLSGASGGGGGFSQFIVERASNPATSVQDAIARNVLPKDPNLTSFVGVSSNYFQLQAAVDVDGVRMQLYSNIIWSSGGATVVSHSFNTD